MIVLSFLVVAIYFLSLYYVFFWLGVRKYDA